MWTKLIHTDYGAYHRSIRRRIGPRAKVKLLSFSKNLANFFPCLIHFVRLFFSIEKSVLLKRIFLSGRARKLLKFLFSRKER
ncbi:hypothetical protein AMJ44_15340 [candidate division WOR-1 bacterium DG_54_3]|uniref:Uncharacterized protein n=1 Tax=candidate division WOR-1 bacterium DG_54_3 TaxID=1703775 RepID=A0A0S7XK90_UNCSA|nr:MAG: hypothetical protein AMJ44_15340 [candidate division WOR-1 bacterium DG_54_3]